MDSHDLSGYDRPPPNHHLKAIGTVFALLIAPIVAGINSNVGSFFVQKKLEAPVDTPPVGAPAAATPPVVAEKAVAVVTPSPAPTPTLTPIAPSVPSPDLARAGNQAFQQALAGLHALPVNHLFDGRDLSGFYTYLGPPEPDGQPIGKNKDPDHIFSVKNALLAISGQELGGLATVNAYENYLLTVEYRWGLRTYRPRMSQPKLGGIVFHGFGPDGAVNGAWLQGYRVRLDENGGGDLWIVANDSADPHLSVEVEPHVVTTAKKHERTQHTYKPGGTLREIIPGHHALRLGTINHLGAIHAGRNGGDHLGEARR